MHNRRERWMDNTAHPLLEFLVISRCRVTAHYQPKLQACLDALDQGQLWQSDETTGHSVGGLILHILEHPRRHTAWLSTGSKPQNIPRYEDFFPELSENPSEIGHLVGQIFGQWQAAMSRLIDEIRAGGTLPDGGPDMGAIYHLVEHIAYHLAQVIRATEGVTRHKFDFCRQGIDEKMLRDQVNEMMEGLGKPSS
jgi:hypothetical protein